MRIGAVRPGSAFRALPYGLLLSSGVGLGMFLIPAYIAYSGLVEFGYATAQDAVAWAVVAALASGVAWALPTVAQWAAGVGVTISDDGVAIATLFGQWRVPANAITSAGEFTERAPAPDRRKRYNARPNSGVFLQLGLRSVVIDDVMLVDTARPQLRGALQRFARGRGLHYESVADAPQCTSLHPVRKLLGGTLRSRKPSALSRIRTRPECERSAPEARDAGRLSVPPPPL